MTDTELQRVRVIKGTPPCSPGKCVICGNCGDKESNFIDFGFDIDFYGIVYFCEICICQVLTVLDYIPTDELRRVKRKLVETQYMLDALKPRYEELAGVVQHIRDLDIVSDSSSEQSGVVEIEQASDPATESVSGKATTTESGSTKQTNESGSTGVHSDDAPKNPAPEFEL
jgi:hypothetical protein